MEWFGFVLEFVFFLETHLFRTEGNFSPVATFHPFAPGINVCPCQAATFRRDSVPFIEATCHRYSSGDTLQTNIWGNELAKSCTKFLASCNPSIPRQRRFLSASWHGAKRVEFGVPSGSLNPFIDCQRFTVRYAWGNILWEN